MNLSYNDFEKNLLGNRIEGKNSRNRRLLITAFLFSLVGFVVIIKIFEINYKKELSSNTLKDNKINTTNDNKERGIIKDRNGRILASNIFKYNLKAYPKNIHNVDETIKKLSIKLPSIDKAFLKRKLNDKTKYEVLIKKNVSAPKAKEINNMGLPGLEFFSVMKRFYPHQNLTSHLLGHVNSLNYGVYGAEKSFNKFLTDGDSISLALDLRVQYAVREELYKTYEKIGAKSAAAIIVDLNSFEILSLVSLPDFNPNKSINPKIESYRNTSTLNVYEMGSTFKIFTIAAALEKTVINLTSSFDARKPLQVSNYFIHDFHPENRILNTKEVFIKSSNIGASLIGLELGASGLKEFYKKIGILNFSSIDLSEKSRPIVPKIWGKVETATLSFGHGISITPMNMIEAASLIFSDYKFPELSIRKREESKRKSQNKFLSLETKKALLDLMEENVLNGTGKKAFVKGYDIGGKTATGEKTKKGKYEKDKLVSSFLSVFPAKNPKYISLVLFDEPNFRINKNTSDSFTGGATAAPTTSKILKRILPILGLPINIEAEQQLIVKEEDNLNFASY